MSFPWHAGAAPAPAYRRVIKGQGFADPHSQFLAHRAVESARQETARSQHSTNRLNARSAWEDQAEKRLERARAARDEAVSQQEAEAKRASRFLRLKELYANDWSGWMGAVEARSKAGDRPPLDQLRAQVGTLTTAREKEKAEFAREAYERRALAELDIARPLEQQVSWESVRKRLIFVCASVVERHEQSSHDIPPL